MSDYFKNRDKLNLQKIDAILCELPEYVGYFIMGISQRTSTLTRLNYSGDIKTFYYYLINHTFNASTMSDITLDDLSKLVPQDIEKYMNFLSSYTYNNKSLSCGEKSKERKLSSIKSFFKYLFMKDYLSINIMDKVEMPKIHSKPIIKLDSGEISDLLEVVEDGSTLTKRQSSYNKKTALRDLAIVATFLGTGIRVSELVGLNKNDLDFKNNSFLITRKGGNKSILYLPDETMTALIGYMEWLDSEIKNETVFSKKISDHTPLFFSLQGNRISVRAVEILIKKYTSSISPLKKITPHKLRSTFATNLYKQTGDIYVVADVLGHSDINTTRKHYAEMSEDNRRNAAKVTTLRKKQD